MSGSRVASLHDGRECFVDSFWRITFNLLAPDDVLIDDCLRELREHHGLLMILLLDELLESVHGTMAVVTGRDADLVSLVTIIQVVVSKLNEVGIFLIF